jgi:hypothetical protein
MFMQCGGRGALFQATAKRLQANVSVKHDDSVDQRQHCFRPLRRQAVGICVKKATTGFATSEMPAQPVRHHATASLRGRQSVNGVTWIWTLMLSGLALGCSRQGEFPVAPTKGVVLCDGKPVPHVMVFFEPLAGGDPGSTALVGKQGFAFADDQGRFVISTYGKQDGAVVGRHRVRVGPPHPEDHPRFSCPCVLNPEVDVMEVEVVKGKVNEFQVVLARRTGRETRPLGY